MCRRQQPLLGPGVDTLVKPQVPELRLERRRALRLRGLSQYLSLVEKDAQGRVDPPDGRLVERVFVGAGGNQLDDDGRVLALERVVYQLGERVPVIGCLGGDGDAERPVTLARSRLQGVEQLPVRRDAKLVVYPQRRRQAVGGFLIARQHGVDSALAGPAPTSIVFQNEVALMRNCSNSGHRADDGLDLGKDKSGLLGAACGAVDLAAGLSLRAEQVAANKPGNEPRLAVAPRNRRDRPGARCRV